MIQLDDVAPATHLSTDELGYLADFLLSTGSLTPEAVRENIVWFVRDLGIDAYYFRTTPVEELGRHILALASSEMVARHGGDGVAVQLVSEQSHKAIYIVEDRAERVREVELRIEKRYPRFRLESYLTGTLPGGGVLRFYIATRPGYPDPETTTVREADRRSDDRKPFPLCATTSFLERSLPATIERYRTIWNDLNGHLAPIIHISEKKDSNEMRIMVGLHGSESRRILTSFSQLFDNMQILVRRRYIEPFNDNKYVLTFYSPPIDVDRVETLRRELNAVAMLPRNPITALFSQARMSAQQTMYAVAAATFAHQFVSELSEGYHLLQEAVASNPEALGVLQAIRSNMTKNTFSTARITTTVLSHPEVVALLYRHFCAKGEERNRAAAAIGEALKRDVPYHRDRTILDYFRRFNESVKRTNFFVHDAAALVFRMGRGFLDAQDYGEEPFGIFFLVGREFSGFHVRFRDIARGGVRIVRSRTADAWSRNVDTIFQENYNLAATQQRKNKDIPEGGSKGIVLLSPEFGEDTEAADGAFRGYADALIDLMVQPSDSPEVLFLGPDEGSAGLMDWAALHAKKRDYPFWKSFTTGKSLALGGIPHDRYGMTTRSVHTFATAALEKLGLAEEAIRKVQTGGPDGDLGSNEILISRDKTVAIVDGSGVLYDPDGIDRDELVRLARSRRTVASFPHGRLSDRGFFVAVDDRDITLPDGSVHANGEQFRNTFHLSRYMDAELFVPCGGRPGAITIANWKALLYEDGTPRIRALVEGANLFVTQEARVRLEERGVVVLKDASTNKGGVTSSSLEVYAGLAMSDEEFEHHMCVDTDSEDESPFRRAYVEAIIKRIETNARAEFDLMWTERELSGRPLTYISDEVSARINRITDAIGRSDLLHNATIRRAVIAEYTPAPLLELVGLERIVERVPRSYLDAIVASRIASRFVYERGLRSTEVEFAMYVEELKRE
ncbi:MAG: NAD-glutamate dehydrogenase [Spirochaetales bacterium]|nr:NAD-glutamate dehydrogenase [Spirochaetales bacterium]